MHLRPWLALVAALLAGCAGQTRIYNTEVAPAYSPTEYGYGAGRRDLTTVIRGDPFQLGEEPFQAQFVELLNRHQPIMQPTHFTTTPGPSARPIYRAVFVFDSAYVQPTALCQQPLDVPPADTGPTVRVIAAFCRWGGYLTTATGEVDVASLDDPRFASLIGQMVLVLFPPVDPTEDQKRWLFADAKRGLSRASVRAADG